MKIRNKLLTLAAALVLMASAAIPIALAAPPPVDGNAGNNETDAVVVITSGGAFDAYFCIPPASWAQFQPVPWVDPTAPVASTNTLTQQSPPPTAHTAGLATGTLYICYTDTHSIRNEFNTQVQATQFTSTDAVYWTPIAASNFKVTQTHNVIQEHWSSDGHGHVPYIGDIGSFVNEASVAQNTLPLPWTTNNSLDTARNVQFGYNGIGTNNSWGQFDVELTIPAGTAPGTYKSDVTLTIITGTQTKTIPPAP